MDPDLQADAARASATTTCGSSSSPTSASPTTWPATCTPRWRRARSAPSGCRRCATATASTTSRTLADEIIERSRGGHAGRHPRAARPARYRVERRARPRRRQPDRHRLRAHGRPRGRRDPRRLRRQSSPASPWGINVVKNYTHAYTTFTVRSRAQPRHPQQPRQPGADQGRGARRARSSTPCRRSRAPPATSSGCSCPTRCSRRSPRSRPSRRWPRAPAPCGRCRSTATTTTAARSSRRCSPTPAASAPGPTKPGLDACSYPTGVAAVPIEVVEASAPIRFLRKALRPGSGGARRADRRARPDDRVHRRHHPAVAAQRRHEPPGRSPAGHLRRRARARPVASASTARPSPRRPGSRCSPATSCASTCRAAAATGSDGTLTDEDGRITMGRDASC